MRSLCRVVLVVCLIVPASSVQAETVADLLPEHTTAFFRIRNTSEFGEHLNRTALAKAMQDEEIAPIAERLMGSLGPAMEDFQSETGITPGEFFKMAPGELAIGLVCLPAFQPAVVVMFQADEEAADFSASVDLMVENGFEKASETKEGIKLSILRRPDGPVKEVIQMQLGEWRCITTMQRVAEKLIALYRGDPDTEPLSSVQAFKSIQTQCASNSIEAHLEWYIDPISTARSFLRGNFAATAGLAILPAIGADGIQAIGGSIVAADDEYDMIGRTHLLIEPPRNGVTEMLALRAGTIQPEKWVPANAALYSTLHVDPQVIYETLAELVDSFRSEGSLSRWVQGRMSEPAGIDLEAELLPAMAGRYTLFQVYDQPPTFNGQRNVIGIELVDPVAFRDTLEKLRERWSERVDVESFAGVDLYKIKPDENEAPQIDDRDDDDDDNPRRRRRREARRRRQRRQREMWLEREPVVAIVGQSLVMADRIKVMEQVILTYNGNEDRMRDELDYKLVVSKLKRQSATQPSMIRFERPEVGLEAAYSLLSDPDVREWLDSNEDNNPTMAELKLAIEEDRLPPFEIISKYFAPTGSIIFNEETGIHHIGFGLKRDLE